MTIGVIGNKNCVCCNGNNLRKIWNKNNYDFVRCAECELIFLDPLPTEKDVNAFYEKDFFLNAQMGYQNYAKE